jgi:hypothetical protein
MSDRTNKLGTASFILGILSIILWLGPVWDMVGKVWYSMGSPPQMLIYSGAVGDVFGIIGMYCALMQWEKWRTKFAVTGLVLSMFGTALSSYYFYAFHLL